MTLSKRLFNVLLTLLMITTSITPHVTALAAGQQWSPTGANEVSYGGDNSPCGFCPGLVFTVVKIPGSQYKNYDEVITACTYDVNESPDDFRRKNAPKEFIEAHEMMASNPNPEEVCFAGALDRGKNLVYCTIEGKEIGSGVGGSTGNAIEGGNFKSGYPVIDYSLIPVENPDRPWDWGMNVTNLVNYTAITLNQLEKHLMENPTLTWDDELRGFLSPFQVATDPSTVNHLKDAMYAFGQRVLTVWLSNQMNKALEELEALEGSAEYPYLQNTKAKAQDIMNIALVWYWAINTYDQLDNPGDLFTYMTNKLADFSVNLNREGSTNYYVFTCQSVCVIGDEVFNPIGMMKATYTGYRFGGIGNDHPDTGQRITGNGIVDPDRNPELIKWCHPDTWSDSMLKDMLWNMSSNDFQCSYDWEGNGFIAFGPIDNVQRNDIGMISGGIYKTTTPYIKKYVEYRCSQGATRHMGVTPLNGIGHYWGQFYVAAPFVYTAPNLNKPVNTASMTNLEYYTILGNSTEYGVDVKAQWNGSDNNRPFKTEVQATWDSNRTIRLIRHSSGTAGAPSGSGASMFLVKSLYNAKGEALKDESDTSLSYRGGACGKGLFFADLDFEKDDGFSIKVNPKDQEVSMSIGSTLQTDGKITLDNEALTMTMVGYQDRGISTCKMEISLTPNTADSYGVSNIAYPVVNGFTGANGTYVRDMSIAEAIGYCTGTDIVFAGTATSSSTANAKVSYIAKINFIVDGIPTPVKSADPVSLGNNQFDSYADEDYASFKGVSNEAWWEFHTTSDPDCYAQIKANECKAEDWEALQGIPSTENLFVVGGATMYLLDVSGTYHVQNNITRKTTFQVTVNNVWETLTPCGLKCESGHSYSCGSFSYPNSAGCGGSHTGCSSCGGDSWSDSGAPHPAPEGDPPVMVDHPCGGDSMSHSGSASVKFNCSTGEWSKESSGDGTFEITPSSSPCSCGQHYIGTCSYKLIDCGGKTVASGTHSYTCPGVIDEGYTTGRGCQCDGYHNFEHPQVYVKHWYIEEKIPAIYYLNLRSYAAYGVYRMTITNRDSSIIDTNCENNSVHNQLKVSAFDITNNTAANAANYVSGNGRLQFTRFKDWDYKNGPGWIQTNVALANGSNIAAESTSYYWFGDQIIIIDLEADYPASGWKTGTFNTTQAVRTGGGKLDGQCEATSESTVTAWKSGRWTKGDLMTNDEVKIMTSSIVNQWMGQQDTSPNAFHCMVVSDSFSISSKAAPSTNAPAEWYSQNVCGAVYDVTEGIGVGLLSVPTLPSNEGSVYATYTHTPQKVYTRADLFNSPSNANKRSMYNIDEVMFAGFKGSPGGEFGENSYSYITDTGKVVKEQFNITDALLGSGTDYQANASNLPKNFWVNAGNDGPITVTESDSQYPNVKYRVRMELSEPNRNDPNGGPDFTGYHFTHVYISKKTGSISQSSFTGMYHNGKVTLPTADSLSYVNSVDLNLREYNLPFVITMLDMVDTAPNGVYERPVTVNCYYTPLIEKIDTSGSSPKWSTYQPKNKANGKSGYKMGFNGTGTDINPIIVHDPVSVEFNKTISMAKTDPGEDDRVNSLSDSDPSKPTYVVLDNDFYVFVSDYGDFYDSAGYWGGTGLNSSRGVGEKDLSWESTSTIPFSHCLSAYKNRVFGEGYPDPDSVDWTTVPSSLQPVVTGSLGRTPGYTDGMFTTRWIDERYVSFPFAVNYKHKDGSVKTLPANSWLALSTVQTRDVGGSYKSPVIGNVSGPDAVVYPYASSEDEEVNGWTYCFYIHSSAQESKASTVKFAVRAINDPQRGNTQDAYGNTVAKNSFGGANGTTNKSRDGYTAPHLALNSFNTEVVGRIGNLQIEDSADFRYSTLFKQANSGSLIDGVVNTTGETKNVIATKENILQQLAGVSTNGHATSSILYRETTLSNGSIKKIGKAQGDFLLLPLSASLLEDKSYKQDSVKLGYKLYCDFETMGNYYGINTRAVTRETGSYDADGNMLYMHTFESAYEDIPEENFYRSKFTELRNDYWLLDLETGEYIPVDIYYGSKGTRSVAYEFGNYVVDSGFSSYTEFNNELTRRNITKAARDVTSNSIAWLNANNLDAHGQATSGYDHTRDMIGTCNRLVLDAKNVAYIGSSVGNGKITDSLQASIAQQEDFDWNGVSIGKNTMSYDLNYINSPFSFTYKNSEAYSGTNVGISEVEYGVQHQLWNFVVELPSTAYVVPAKSVLGNYVSGATAYTSQSVLETAHEAFKKKHPNAVIVLGSEIYAHGDVWTLKYDNSNNPMISNGLKVYADDTEGLPDGVTPGRVYPYPDKPEDIVIAIFEAWENSSVDLESAGTH